MNYEKAYKEALNWMRSIYPTLTGSDKEDAEHYFPELAESEDERIRKEIIEFFKNFQKHGTWKAIPCVSEWIAYLEKQKEYVSDNFDDVWTTEDCAEIIEAGEKLSPRFKELLKEACHAWYDKGIELGKHKEQKPLMLDGEVEDKKRDIVAAIRKYYSTDYAEYLTSFLKGLSPEDNSEDDYGQEMLGIAYKLMYEHIPEKLRTQEFWDSLKFMREYTGKVAIIYPYENSAKCGEKQKEQSLTANDLDEEIERFFDDCIIVHDAKIYGVDKRVIEVSNYELTARHFAEWGEKQKEQKPNNTYKPTYEQLEALRFAVNHLAKKYVSQSVRLSILYDHLKELDEQKSDIEICPHSIKSKSYKEQKPMELSEEDLTDFEIEVHEIIAQARSDSRLNDADALKQFEEEAAFALMLKANKLIEQEPVERWQYVGKVDLEKNKEEQKPVEIHIDNPNIQKIDPDVKISTSDSSASGDELLYVSQKNIELIQKSWYMEGYNDRKFNKEPKWIIRTGEEGPRYEENPKYGQVIEQKPAEWSDDPIEAELVIGNARKEK